MNWFLACWSAFCRCSSGFWFVKVGCWFVSRFWKCLLAATNFFLGVSWVGLKVVCGLVMVGCGGGFAQLVLAVVLATGWLPCLGSVDWLGLGLGLALGLALLVLSLGLAAVDLPWVGGWLVRGLSVGWVALVKVLGGLVIGCAWVMLGTASSGFWVGNNSSNFFLGFLFLVDNCWPKSVTFIRQYAAPTFENSVQLFSFLALLEVGGVGGFAACGFGVFGGVFFLRIFSSGRGLLVGLSWIFGL